MKLHLPKGLRAAVLACFAAFAGIGTTITTATVTGGVFAVTIAGQAMADDYSTDITELLGSKEVNITGDVSVTCDGGYTGFTTGAVTVSSGCSLTLTKDDNLGWGSPTPSVTLLAGTEDNVTELILGSKQTMATKITLNGYSNVSSGDVAESLSSFGGSITATETNNTISASIGLRKALDITVTDATDTLIIAGSVQDDTQSDFSQGTITKYGAGTLTFKADTGRVQTLVYGLTVSEGAVANETAGLTIGGTLDIKSGATFTLGADVTLTGDIANAGTLAFTNGATLTLSQDAINAVIKNGGSLGAYSGTVSLAGLEGNQSYTTDNGVITLLSNSAALTWNGGSGTWSANGTGWNSATVTDGTQAFSNGDKVTFTSSATVALGSDVTVEDMTVSAAADLTLTGSQTLDVMSSLTVDGTLALTEGTLTFHDGASFMVAEGKTATINLPSGTTKDVDTGKYAYWDTTGAIWDILSSGKSGETISKGTVILDGDTGYDAGAGSVRTVYGNYVVTGSFHSSNGGNSLSINIGAGSSLRVLGTAELENAQSITVSGAGSVFSAGKLILGHNSAGSYPASVTIGADSVVTLQGVQIRSTHDNTFVKLDGGRLNLGSDGFTFDSRVNSDSKYFKLVSGTLGTTADSVTYALALTTAGSITVDTTKQDYDATTGLASAGSTGATIGLTGGLTMAAGNKLTVDGKGTLTLGGTVKLADAIALGANASLAFAENTKLDLSGLTAVDSTYTLLTGEGNRDLRYLETLAGLEITGTGVAGNLSWTFTENGTLSYKMGASSVWAGGDMTWTSTAWTPTTGEPTAYSQGSYVVFSGGESPVASVVTLGENVSASTVVIEDGAVVTLQSAAETSNKLTVSSSIELSGELVVVGDVLSSDSTVTAEGENASLVLDGVTINDYATLATGYTGALTLANVDAITMSNTSISALKSLTLREGSTVTINGDGATPTIKLKGGLLKLSNWHMFDGTIELVGDTAEENVGTVTAEELSGVRNGITGTGSLTLTGGSDSSGLRLQNSLTFVGDLTLKATSDSQKNIRMQDNGSIANTGHVTVDGANVKIASGSSLANINGNLLVKSGSIQMESGSTLTTGKLEVSGGTFYAGSGITTLSVTGVNQSGGTVNLDSALTLSGDSTSVALTGGSFVTSVAQTLAAPLTLGAVTFGDGQEANSGAITLGTAGQSIAITGTASNKNALTLIGNFTLTAEALAQLEGNSDTGVYTLIKGEAGASLTLDANATISVEGVESPLAVVIGENGTATFTIPPAVDVVKWLGGDMTWNADTLFADDKSWAADSYVTFVGGESPVVSNVTLGEDVTVGGISIESGADVTLGGDYKLTASGGIAVTGSLTITGDVIASGTGITGTGDFTVAGGSVDYTSQLSGFAGDVTVTGTDSGLTLSAANSFASLSVEDGATLNLTTKDFTHNDNKTISLNGGNVVMNSNRLNGILQLTAAGATNSLSAVDGAAVYATISGDGNMQLGKDGGSEFTYYGTMNFKGDATFAGNQNINVGFNNWGNAASIANIGNVLIDGATVSVDTNSGQETVSTIKNDGNLEVKSGSLTINERAAIDLSSASEGKGLLIVSGGTMTVKASSENAFTLKGLTVSGGELNIARAITGGENFSLSIAPEGKINVDITALTPVTEGDPTQNGLMMETYALVTGLTGTIPTLDDSHVVYVDGTAGQLKLNDAGDAIVFGMSTGIYNISTGDVGYADVAAAEGVKSISFNGGTLVHEADATVDLGIIGGTAAAKVSVAAGVTATWATSGTMEGTQVLVSKGLEMSDMGTLVLHNKEVSYIGEAGTEISVRESDATLRIVAEKAGNNTIVRSDLTGGGTVELQSVQVEGADTASLINIEGSTANFNGSLVLDNATFRLTDTTVAAGVELADNSENLFDDTDATTLSGELSGSGTLKLQNGGALTIAGATDTFTGTLSNNGGDATYTISSSGAVGAVGSALTSSGDGAATYKFTSEDDVTLNALVSGNANVVKQGAGTLELTQANTSTGMLTVEAGTAELAYGSVWAGDISVAENSTLLLEGARLENMAITSSGTVQLSTHTNDGGEAQYSRIGDLTGGTLIIDADNAATIENVTVATLENNGRLYANGETLTVDALTNNGTVSLGSAATLTITAASTTAGKVTGSGSVVLAGDTTFTSLSAASVSADGATVTLTGAETSSITAVTSGSSLAVQGSTLSLGSGSGTVEVAGLALSNTATVVVKDAALHVTGDVTTCDAVGAQTAGNAIGLEATNDVTVDGSVSLEGGSLVSTSGSITVGGLVNITGNMEAAGNVSLGNAPTADADVTHSIGGNLAGGGTLTLADQLTVTETMSGITSIVVADASALTTTDSLVTVGALTLGDVLTFSVTDSMLPTLAQGDAAVTYTLLDSGSALADGILDKLNLDLKTTAVAAIAEGNLLSVQKDAMLYTLGVDGNTITLTAAFNGDVWNPADGATEGTLDSTTSTENSNLVFNGGGTDATTGEGTVNVGAPTETEPETTLGSLTVDAAGDTYNFTSEDPANPSTLATTGGLHVTEGTANVENVTINVGTDTTIGGDAESGTLNVGEGGVVSTAGDMDIADNGSLSVDGGTVATTGETTVSGTGTIDVTGGSFSSGSVAVEDTGSFTISGGDVTIDGDLTVADTATLVVGGADLAVSGALDAAGTDLTKMGEVSLGAGSNVGNISGANATTSTVTVTGGNATLGDVSKASSLAVTGGGADTVTVGTVSTGSISADGSTLDVTAINGTTTLEATDGSAVTVTGTTNMTDGTVTATGSTIDLQGAVAGADALSASGSAASLTAASVDGANTLGATGGATVTVTGTTTLDAAAAEDANTITAGGTDSTVQLAGVSNADKLEATDGAEINAGDITMRDGGEIIADNAAINVGSVENISNMTASNGASITSTGDIVMTAGDETNELVADGANLALGSVTDAYILTASNGGTLTVDSLTMTDADAMHTVNLDEGTGANKVTLTTGDLTVKELNSGANGTLELAAGKLTIASENGAAVTAGGNIKATEVDLSSITKAGSVFESIETGRLTINVSELSGLSETDSLYHINGDLTKATTFAFVDNGLELELTGIPSGADGIDSPTAVGATAARDWADDFAAREYTILSVGGQMSDLTLIAPDAADIKQLFAVIDMDAKFIKRTEGGVSSIILSVQDVTDRSWSSDNENWAGSTTDVELGIDLTPGRNPLAVEAYDRFNTVTSVKLTSDYAIDLTGEEMTEMTDAERGVTIRELTGNGMLELEGDGVWTGDAATGDLVTLINSGDTTLAGDLAAKDITVQVEATANTGALKVTDIGLDGAELVVQAGQYNGSLTGEKLTMTNDSVVTVEDGATLKVSQLNGADEDSGTISGKVTVNGTGGNYSGKYDNATVALAQGAQQTLAPKSGLTLTSVAGVTSAKATLDYAAGSAEMDKIKVTNTTVTLNNMSTSGVMNTLDLGSSSSMVDGELAFKVNAMDVADGLNGAGNTPTITTGAALNLNGTKVSVTQADTAVERTTFDVSKGTQDRVLFTISEGATTDDVKASMGDSKFFSRYFENIEVKDGKVIADLVTNYYTRKLGLTENGRTGLQMLDAAALEINPLGVSDAAGINADYKDLAGVLKTLEECMVANGSRDVEADKLGAAVAGAGLASFGMAISDDMERQLKAIRNRTTTMGVDNSVVNEDMPYFNAWINAEGDYRSMDAESTLSGYTMSSWGGTVGFDMDVNPNLTWGLAATAMHGDYEAESADIVEADVETYYLTAFARVSHSAWVHTFVASLGMSSSELSRTVSHANGSYSTDGETDGMSFGLLYEVGRTFAMNEDATACWQPVVNVAYRHISLDGYNETGSDAALRVGDQSLDMVTFGLGARVQAVVGENIYNRTSVFEARALAKLDAGDRDSQLDTALLSASTATGTVSSSEVDAFGVELGAGITVPVGIESGSIFVDGSFEFRGSYTSANGTVGYRLNF